MKFSQIKSCSEKISSFMFLSGSVSRNWNTRLKDLNFSLLMGSWQYIKLQLGFSIQLYLADTFCIFLVLLRPNVQSSHGQSI